uniref:RadC family protein n=1 Tax=Acetatifactor sp. TaxID=1872090 RepID=UPI004055A002
MKDGTKQLQTQDLPYEKFLRFGPEHLTERELIAIILRTGTKDSSALELAEKVLSLAKYPREGLLGLYDVSLDELMSIKGIGMVKAIKLKCLTELSMRISQTSARQGLCFRRPGSVAEYFMEALRHRDTECVILVCLDSKGQMLREKMISNGSVNMSLISPREIFLEALQCKAVNIMLVHNHPSGDPTPSKADKILTENVRDVGEKMEIPLLDHIIIGDNRYTSFKELSYL